MYNRAATDSIPTSIDGISESSGNASDLELPKRRLEDGQVGVLIVSPNPRLRAELSARLNRSRWNLSEALSGSEAIEALQLRECAVVLLDPILPDLMLDDFRGILRELFPNVQVISVNPESGMLVLGTASPTGVVARLTEDVYRDEKPKAAVPMPTKIAAIRPTSTNSLGIREIVGESAGMRRVYKMVRMVAQRSTTVLVTGESGTGKDLVASAVHCLSDRHKQPLITINCAAIPEPLLEAELFGYTKGSFTGAIQSRIGRIQAAHGGTLFLDEIGDMPLALQSKILRFLEQGEVQRIGGNDNLKVDVRVVAATNSNLQELVKQKLFREDLYYRLHVFPVNLPPLRERYGDVRLLAQFFLSRFAPGAVLSQSAMALLDGHDWKGNVRELRNVIERACILAEGSGQIHAEHILI